MTVPNPTGSSGNNGFGRSIGDAAGRGAVLVGIAVLIGAFLLWAGFDRSSGDASTDDSAATDTSTSDAGADTGDDSGADGQVEDSDTGDQGQDDGSVDTTTGDTVPPPSTVGGEAHPPNEVVVFVANGSGVAGEAGRVAERLTAANYTAVAGNAANAATENSKIFYRPTYGEDAKLIAEVLQAPASTIQQMPEDPGVSPENQAEADGANVIVIIAVDEQVAG